MICLWFCTEPLLEPFENCSRFSPTIPPILSTFSCNIFHSFGFLFCWSKRRLNLHLSDYICFGFQTKGGGGGEGGGEEMVGVVIFWRPDGAVHFLVRLTPSWNYLTVAAVQRQHTARRGVPSVSPCTHHELTGGFDTGAFMCCQRADETCRSNGVVLINIISTSLSTHSVTVDIVVFER